MDLIHLYRCEFTDSDTEEYYRDSSFESSKLQAKIGFIIMAISMLLFVRADKAYIVNNDIHEEVLYLRIIFAVMTFTILFLWNKAKNYQMGDIIILAWTLFTFVVITFINLTREAQFSFHHMTDILIVLSFYIFFPNRFIYQIIPAILHSVVNMIIFSNLDVVTVMEINTVTFFHIAANFMGIFISYRTHKMNRIFYHIIDKKTESE